MNANANTNGTIEVWKEKLNSFKFSDERIEELEALLAMVPKSKLPDGDSEKDSRNLYMMQKIAKLIRVENDKRVEGGRIRSRFFYLKSLLEKDIVMQVHNAKLCRGVHKHFVILRSVQTIIIWKKS